MISEPLFIVLILVAVVVVAQKMSTRFADSALMKFIPIPVWCYIPPTLLTTAGVLPISSPVYVWISHYALPACLILLLMTTDIPGLRKVGSTALIAMTVATASIVLGGIGAFFIFRDAMGEEAWKAIGTMTGSLIGGTVNMIAVKQATNLSEEMLTPLFIADITVVYVWMTLLMVLSSSQNKLDRFLHAKRTKLNQALEHAGPPKSRTKRIPMRSLILLLMIGFGVGYAARWIGNQLPEVGMAVTQSTWIIIIVTTAGLVLSAAPVSRREGANALKIGYFLLFLVLAATGAQANLLAIFKAPIFLVIGFTWIGIHACILLGAGRLFKIPSAMLATASQANLGGVASAPVVASTFEPRLVPIALILAILGNALGNYLGILTGQLLLAIG